MAVEAQEPDLVSASHPLYWRAHGTSRDETLSVFRAENHNVRTKARQRIEQRILLFRKF